MSVITDEIVNIINDSGSVKVIATSDENGSPNLAFKQCLTVLENGDLAFAEAFEGSQTNINLVRSIWFDRDVGISVRSKEGRIFRIKGKPHKYVYSGPLYKRFLKDSRLRWGPDSELGGVWLITPYEAVNESYVRTKSEEDKQHPFLRHLDRESVYPKGGKISDGNYPESCSIPLVVKQD